jgi:hypothetical protein
MGASQRTFQKSIGHLDATRLSLDYQGKCGQYDGGWYYVPGVNFVGPAGGTVLLTIALTPLPAGPNGCATRDLKPLLSDAVEVPPNA